MSKHYAVFKVTPPDRAVVHDGAVFGSRAGAMDFYEETVAKAKPGEQVVLAQFTGWLRRHTAEAQQEKDSPKKRVKS